MKKIFLLFALIYIKAGFSQQPTVLYCNSRENVAIIMPSPISTAITGADNYVFSYNQKVPDTLGLLQGRAGGRSNLFIRTTDGHLYSFILKFRDTLSTFTYFIDKKQYIHQKRSVYRRNPDTVESRKFLVADSLNKVLCEHVLRDTKERKGSLVRKRKHGLKFSIKGVNYLNDRVYLSYEIVNSSSIDFELNQITLSIIQGSKKRKSSYQKRSQSPVFQYNFPTAIPSGQRRMCVLVYPKFTLNDRQQVQITMSEKSGSRYLSMTAGENRFLKGLE